MLALANGVNIWVSLTCSTHAYFPRSASNALSVQISRTRLSTVGSRAFSVFGPSAWSELPLPLRQTTSRDCFKSVKKSFLKIFLFPKQYTCHVFRSRCYLPPHQNRLLSVEVGCKFSCIVVVGRFYIALFSALDQTHCARSHVILHE